MERFFIELSYNGYNYCGWQRQNNGVSVEQVVEESLTKLLGCNVDIVGCGRTDAGVHASFCVAHFEVETTKVMDNKFVYHLNAILPRDIEAFRIYKTDKHARFDAKEREYKYYICKRKPIYNNNIWQVRYDLDVEDMNRASQFLCSVSDFTSFAKLGSDNKTNICKIVKAHWERCGDEIVFTIVADRFLRGMVRGVVGTLVEVGRGKISVEEFERVVESKNRANASAQAPANALFLTNVKY